MRIFLSVFLLISINVVLGEKQHDSKKNVVFIVVDDLSIALSNNNWPGANSPNIDQLARSGRDFKNAFCQFSVCNPSRQSFLTGCYPQRTQVYDLKTSFRDALPDIMSLPQYMKNSGYTTVGVGKIFHVKDNKTTFDFKAGAYIKADQSNLLQAKKNDMTDRMRKGSHPFNRPYAECDNQNHEFTDHKIADEAIEKLAKVSKQPFFMTIGFIRPHTPWVAPKWAFEAIDAKQIELPPYFSGQRDYLNSIPAVAKRPNNNAFRYEDSTVEQAQKAIHAYLAAIHFMDFQVGRVIQKLKELKLLEDTYIILTSDHGYHLGEHNLWAKQTLFDLANHVPLIITGPGISAGETTSMSELVDIYPTICELVHLPVPSHVEGKSLLPILENPMASVKNNAFSSMNSSHGKEKVLGHSIRNQKYRFISWGESRGLELFYDLEKDSEEINNLIDHPEYSNIIDQMRDELQQHLKSF